MSNRPTPSALRRLSGSNLHRINQRESRFTKIATVLAAAPAWLDALGREEFERLAPELIANGLLNRANLTLFAARCDAYARMVHAARELAAEGRWITEPKFNKAGEQVGEERKPSPMLVEVSRAARDMMRIDIEFGLTPAAATKVAAEPAGTGKAESFGEFLQGADTDVVAQEEKEEGSKRLN